MERETLSKMMHKSGVYIFVNHCMSGVGGGQRYVLSKASWLKEKGWKVLVCHVADGEIVLPISEVAEVFDILELRAAPCLLGEKRVQKVLAPVLACCKGAKKVVVESSAPYLGFWGEEIAHRTKGRHLCYVLEENPSTESARFISFKYKRHELACINERIAAKLIDGSDSNSTNYTNCVMGAWNPSPFAECDCAVSLPDTDFTIGCITRLEKPYVEDMMRGVAEFCRRVPNKSVAMILVGDSPDEACRQKVLSWQNRVKNLVVVVTGYMSPVPLSLVKSFDLCIGKAGAAVNCAIEGVPTIAYSLDTDELLGLLCYEIPSIATNPKEAPKGRFLEDIIEQVLVEEKWKGTIPAYSYPPRIIPDYSDHLTFLSSDTPMDYFVCRLSQVSFKRILVSLWIMVFGNLKYEQFIKRW